MTVFGIDTCSRELHVFTASMTRVAESGGLVLRMGAQLGRLTELLAAGNGQLRLNMPLVVVGGGYAARSSDGFVGLHIPGYMPRVEVVGGAGFGYEKYLESGEYRRVGDGLRRFPAPWPALLLPAGCVVEAVLTHGNSNPATAAAAAAGLELLAGPDAVVVTEGQSDWTRGYRVQAPRNLTTGEPGRIDRLTVDAESIPPEHRAEMFTAEAAAVDAAVRDLIVRSTIPDQGTDRRTVWAAARNLAALLVRAGQVLPEPLAAAVVDALGVEPLIERLTAREACDQVILVEADCLRVVQDHLVGQQGVPSGPEILRYGDADLADGLVADLDGGVSGLEPLEGEAAAGRWRMGNVRVTVVPRGRRSTRRRVVSDKGEGGEVEK